MSSGLARLRAGEWLMAVAAIVFVVSLFALRWYGGADARDGWQALPVLRWLVLVTVVVAFAAAAAQLRPGPALAAALDVVALLLATITAILLVIGLATTGASLSAGAFVGLGACIATGLGAFLALRTEQGWIPGPERPIELVPLAPDGHKRQHETIRDQ
ncbi:MAG TPA: hypothetical protein VFW09_06070 [Solirubrobacteraceae bacterium]|nr:hypothetical protein [Solirubrobacteraceae bacterium]